MLIDSHAHYCHRRFAGAFSYRKTTCDGYAVATGDLDSLFSEMEAAGITCAIEAGIGLESNQAVLDICKAYPGRLYPAIGIHPTRSVSEKPGARKRLRALAGAPGVVAIGETGLDYHLARKDQHRLRQLFWFCHHIRLAHRLELPLILHIRDAHPQAIRLLRLFRKQLHGGVVHCFAADTATAKAYTELGFHLGIGGSLLQDKPHRQALEEAVRAIPLDRLLLETDAPYVHPDTKPFVTGKPLRRCRNSSLILPRVAEAVATLKGISPEAVAEATSQNTRRLFRLQ